MIQITITYASLEAAITALALLRGSDNPPATVSTSPDKAETGKGKGKTKAAETETQASGSAAPADKPSDASSQAAVSPGVDYATVAKAITDGVAVSKPKVVETLTKFGAKTGKDLNPEQYARFMADLAEALKPGDDLA